MTSPFKLVIPTWATGGNYPAGADPWSGTPVRQTPSQSYWTPKTSDPAQFMNYVQGLQCDALSGLNSNVNSMALMNVPHTFSVPDTYATTGDDCNIGLVLWNPWKSVWVQFLTIDTADGTDDLLESYDGSVWERPSGSTDNYRQVNCGAVDPATGNEVYGRYTNNTAAPHYFYRLAGAHNLVSDNMASGTRTSVTNVAFFNGRFILFGSDLMPNDAAGNIFEYVVTPGTTPTGITEPVGISTACNWETAQSNSLIVLIGITHTGGLTTAPSKYATSSDGMTWTTRTFSFSVADVVVRSICYSTTLSKFFIITEDEAHALPKSIYSSPDGLTWSLVRTFANASVAFDIATIRENQGILYIMHQFRQVSGMYMVSLDGGTTWYQGTHFLGQTNSAGFSPNSTFFDMVLNNNQFMMFNNAQVAGSLIVGTNVIIT